MLDETEKAYTPDERFKEFQEFAGKRISLLSDVDWEVTKDFLERIPSKLERVDFCRALENYLTMG